MLNKKIRIKQSNIERNGLIAQNDISLGESVWKLDEAEQKLTNKEKDELPDHLKDLAFQYKEKFIIVTDGSQYMNHSCEPNTWWTADDELSASKNIFKGEEITYDYSTADIGDWTASWICNCGSQKCRHTISGDDCLRSSFQSQYQKHIPSWVVDYIKIKSSN